MKAIRFHETGGPEVLRWEDVTLGEVGAGQARVRHTAIGVNFIDTYHRTGLYKLPLPSVLGVEAAGVVEAVGSGVSHARSETGWPTSPVRPAPTPRLPSFPPTGWCAFQTGCRTRSRRLAC